MAVVQLVHSFTRIALFLAGAALVRACEHGHLSLRLVVQGWLDLASAGSRKRNINSEFILLNSSAQS